MVAPRSPLPGNAIPYEKHDVGLYPDYLPPPMQAALATSFTTYLEGVGGYRIPIRLFGPACMGTPVVMLHGLESHSVWFVQLAQAIAAQGHAVYLIDRRGSGISTEPRGDLDNYENLVDEIIVVSNYARERHNTERLHLCGHCFGAIPATLVALLHPELLTSLVLTTPGLYTHTDLGIAEKLAVLGAELAHQNPYIDCPIDRALFTQDDDYQTFIRDDSLALKQVSANFYLEVNRARHYIHRHHHKLSAPTYLLLAGQDEIVDNQKTLKLLGETSRRSPEAAPIKHTIFHNAKHILEFSPAIETFFTHVIDWLNKFEQPDRVADADRPEVQK